MPEEQSTRIMRLIKVHSGVLDGLYDAKYGLENVEKALDKAISIMRNNPDIRDKDIYEELKDARRKITEIIKVLEHVKNEFTEKYEKELRRLDITFSTYVYYLFKDYFSQQQ
jgi:spore cortex formation protein SpoVR/YcgB (stage V sporulation)